jgi:hypothetical protein
VEVRYVIPEDTLTYEETWRRHAEEAGARPLYTTHAYAWEPWAFAPVGGGYRLYPAPLTEVPEALGYTPADAKLGPVTLLGYRIAGEAVPGRAVELHLAWQANAVPTSEPSFATRLWDADGAVLAAADRALGRDPAVGEVQITRLTLQLPIDRCTGGIYPTVGVYTVVDGSFQDLGTFSLPEIPARCPYPQLPTRRPHPGAIAGGPLLRGIDYDTQSSGAAWAYVHWCGPGPGLILRHSGAEARVDPLPAGACQSVRLPATVGERFKPAIARPDGTPARLIALPLPAPRPGERYLPYGDQMVLTDAVLDQPGLPAGGAARATRLTLTWRTIRPLEDDYAISVRLRDENGAWLGMHDMQPGLGALPTLKWVVRDAALLDPHVFPTPEAAPAAFSLVVYERFRLTPLTSPWGEEAFYELAHNGVR